MHLIFEADANNVHAETQKRQPQKELPLMESVWQWRLAFAMRARFQLVKGDHVDAEVAFFVTESR